MNGLDDLLIVLEFLTDNVVLPEGVGAALARLKRRQSLHEPFDLQVQAPLDDSPAREGFLR
jgi:hypothetical protein